MSGSADPEVRFAHLLQPIRDLAQNWHIDLATELEDYLHELDSISVHIDPTSSSLSPPSSAPLIPLNFTEAALLIQGSACVYSKKVEYLYSLIYTTLDVILDQKKKEGKKSSSIDAQGEDGDVEVEKEAELLPLDDIDEATNIDMDESRARPYADERRSTLLHRLPPSLSNSSAGASQEKGATPFRVSGAGMSSVQVTPRGALLLLTIAMSPVVCVLADQRLHCPLLRRSAVTTASATVLRRLSSISLTCALLSLSVALLLEGRDNVLLDSSLRRISSDVPFGSPASILRAHRASLSSQSPPPTQPAISVELDFNDDDDNGSLGDAGGAFQDAIVMQESLPSQPAEATAPSPTKQRKAVRFASDGHLCDYRDVERQSMGVDPYALLDPFDASQPTKPFKRGKTQRTYRGEGFAVGCEAFTDSAEYSLVSAEIGKGNFRMPCHAEFATAFMRQVGKRKRQLRLKRRRDGEDRQPTTSHQPQTVDADPLDEADDDAEPFDFFPSLDAGAEAGDAGEAGDDWGDEAPAMPTLALDGDLSAAGLTFEALCREHLDAYLHSADEFVHSSALTQRVREWQDKLEPILEEEDAHPSFDILAYGDRMLGTLEARKDDVDGEGWTRRPHPAVVWCVLALELTYLCCVVHCMMQWWSSRAL